MRKAYFVFVCTLCIACQACESGYTSKFKGYWIAVKQEYILKDAIKFDPYEPPPPPALPGGALYDELFFYSIDSLEHYSFQDYWRNKWAYRDDSTVKLYNGNRRRFRITSRQELQLFDPDSIQWQTRGKINLIKDTLILREKHWETKYVRVNKVNKSDFDELVISSSGCYGTCPVMSVIIKADGKVVYAAEKHTVKKGLYEGELPKELLDVIWFRFRKGYQQGIKNIYMASHTDDESVEVTFVKDGKIVKSVYDYGHQSPQEFTSAYIYLMNRIDNLANLRESNQVQPSEMSFKYSLDEGKKQYRLLHSESFWLWSRLLKARILKGTQVNVALNYVIEKQKNWSTVDINGNLEDVLLEYYSLILLDGKMYKIKNRAKTNGRFILAETLEGEQLLLDIGTNFLVPIIFNRPLEYPYIPFHLDSQ